MNPLDNDVKPLTEALNLKDEELKALRGDVGRCIEVLRDAGADIVRLARARAEVLERFRRLLMPWQ